MNLKQLIVVKLKRMFTIKLPLKNGNNNIKITDKRQSMYIQVSKTLTGESTLEQ